MAAAALKPMRALPADGGIRDPFARFLLSQDFAQLTDKARTRFGVRGKPLQCPFELAAVFRQLECGQAWQGVFRGRYIRWIGRHRMLIPSG
jgi:hypothetical protein